MVPFFHKFGDAFSAPPQGVSKVPGSDAVARAIRAARVSKRSGQWPGGVATRGRWVYDPGCSCFRSLTVAARIPHTRSTQSEPRASASGGSGGTKAEAPRVGPRLQAPLDVVEELPPHLQGARQ